MAQISDIIYCCTMTDRSECRSAGAELLSAFDHQFSSWKDEETKQIRHTLYFSTKQESEQVQKELLAKQKDFASFGVVFEDISLAELKKEDWAESWKIHFKPMILSPRLAISPSWEKFIPAPGQQVVILDPGMSFGTGQHATTKFCLNAIDKFTAEFAAKDVPCRMLDAGAGSGILSIAAYKLGASSVDAFDIDPDTLPVAKENAQVNNVPDSAISMKACSLLDFPGKGGYEIVAANILSSALMEGRDKLLSCCKDGCYLILAGILDAEYAKVRDHFTASGMCTELFSGQEKEWRGGAFLIHKTR